METQTEKVDVSEVGLALDQKTAMETQTPNADGNEGLAGATVHRALTWATMKETTTADSCIGLCQTSP